jgi:hypothetical protein
MICFHVSRTTTWSASSRCVAPWRAESASRAAGS